MKPLVKAWHVPEEWDGCSVKAFLFEYGRFSRQIFKRVKEAGKVLVNEGSSELWKPLRTGDVVTVCFPEEERGGRIFPEEGPLSIVYEDEDLLVLDKPAGVAVIPSIDRTQTSIANRLLGYYDKQGISSTIHIVTRLDKDTSGLMVVAKHAYSHMLLTKEQKQIDRRYKAIVHGLVLHDKGLINEPIARMEGSIIRRTVSKEGKPSQTIYHTEERYNHYSLVELELLTGRTHQIRVHMAHLGNPLAGDSLYGGKEMSFLQGQALHCHQVKFLHPWTNEKLRFISELPESWRNFKKRP
ncbi:RluA family pseudouridine synthase [Halobacillus mangrovi]|uniref:RluA family pseudouridine synthase n=1 Tax=Halobacillus mangrovi TaxID=402384 RepID=UPI003D96E98C